MGALEGRVALVTGSSSGIGRAITLAFVAEGARVACVDVDEPANADTVALSASPERALAIRCDVSVAADCEAAVARARDRFGALHILVNNAAAFVPYGTVVDVSEADWNRSLAVNLTGPFLMSKHALPLIAASGGGSVIHIASQLGQVGKPGHCWYGAAKAALIQLAKVMAIDHADDGIRVNSISPGPVGTARIHRKYGSADAAEKASGSLNVLKRIGRPEEIAGAAVFLASEASSYMTGADLLIDGGYTAW